MYDSIYDFCKIKNVGSMFKNTNIPTPRVQYLITLLENEKIDYVLDIFKHNEIHCYNIILKGTSDKMVVAHHDIVNCNIDNANDNSCSIINAIMIKKLLPNINVILLDGEEVGGVGSQRVSEQILNGEYGDIKYVLNLELTGKGGEHFFIGNYPGKLSEHIIELFKCPIVDTPFNDSVIFRKNGIDSVVINPLPPLEKGKKSQVKWKDDIYLDYNMLFNCHSTRDTIDTICTNDMKLFVENVVVPILSK